MTSKDLGLIDKFTVTRNDGTHKDCKYFVLDLDHDPIARGAAEVYAERAKELGYTKLSNDLMAYLSNTIVPHSNYMKRKQTK